MCIRDSSLSLSLSLSGACHEDVAASTSRRHAGLSIAHRLAVARPKLSGRRSSSTVLSQVYLGLPVLRRQPLGGPRMQTRGAREWSWPMSARHRWPKKDKHCWRIVSDSSGCPVRDRTTSLETKSVQWIRKMRLRHQLSSASIFLFSSWCRWTIGLHITAKVSEEVNRKSPPRNTTVQLQINFYTDPERHNTHRPHSQVDDQADGQTTVWSNNRS